MAALEACAFSPDALRNLLGGGTAVEYLAEYLAALGVTSILIEPHYVDVLCRNLLSIVDPKDRHVVVCLHSGITGVKDIADKLGYANHSPVSKALARIRVKAAKWLV